MSPATRERLATTAFPIALALPVLYAVFVDEGCVPRYWFLATVAAIWFIQFARDRRLIRRPTGDEAAGLTIFVEPVAWTGLKWAYRSFHAAARQAGVVDRIEIFEWSSFWGAVLAVPDLMRLRRNLEFAARLAERIAAHAARYPDSPVHLASYSSGGFIALEALRRLPPGVRVRSLLMQTATVSRDYDLSAALAACDEITNVWSPLDWAINGFGALVFGANDRRHAVPAGTLPFRATADSAGGGKLLQLRWQPVFMRYGYFGEHFTALALPWAVRLISEQRRSHATGEPLRALALAAPARVPA